MEHLRTVVHSRLPSCFPGSFPMQLYVSARAPEGHPVVSVLDIFSSRDTLDNTLSNPVLGYQISNLLPQ
jgi:hypothetical protein